MNQYLYRISPVRPEMLTEGPTLEEQQIVGEHFQYLKQLEADGKLILAGRTQNTDYSSFGIALFFAENDDAAKAILHNDPAVKKRVMRGEVYPYQAAIFNAENYDKGTGTQ